MSTDTQGSLAAEELKSALREKGVDVRQAFKMFDIDGDGIIHRAEFVHGIKRLDVGLSPERIDELVRFIDKDGDGIEYAEFASQTVLHRDPTYFFPDPNVVDTARTPGVLAFHDPEVEGRYLAAHIPSFNTGVTSALLLLFVPLGQLVFYDHAYAAAGLPTLDLAKAANWMEGVLMSVVLLHAWARWSLPRRYGVHGYRYLQYFDGSLAVAASVGLSAAEALAAPYMKFQGYFHPQLLFLVGFVLCSRHMCWRVGVTTAWFSLTVYIGCVAVATLETWPVQQKFAYNSSGRENAAGSWSDLTDAPPTVTHEATFFLFRAAGWFGVTIDDPFGNTTEHAAMLICGVFAVVLCACITVASIRSELSEREAWEASLYVRALYESAAEQDWKLDNILAETLPKHIVPLLKETQNSSALQAAPNVSVLVAELVGFEEFSDSVTVKSALATLNTYLEAFDAESKRHECEKIKCDFGSRYIAVAGLPMTRKDHATLAAECALSIAKRAQALVAASPGTIAGIRIGVHSGPVVAGLIGSGPLIYDVWGETVAIASRIMMTADTNAVLVSPATATALEKHYSLSTKGAASLKTEWQGSKSIKTHVLEGRKYGNEYAQGKLGLHFHLSDNASLAAVNISSSVRTLCAFPPRADWSVLRAEKAKEPQRFGDGLKAFGSSFPFPQFRHHRQHGWEFSYSKMELETSLGHHQLTLVAMILLLACAELSVQMTCAAVFSCPSISLQIWIHYVLLCFPICAMLALVVIGSREKRYIRNRDFLLMMLVVGTAIAFVVYADAMAPSPTTDLGQYGTVAVMMYTYFGGYIRWTFAVPSALLSSTAVVFACLFLAKSGDSERWGVLKLHVAVHMAGSCTLANFERARRLYFGWWTQLRKVEEDKVKSTRDQRKNARADLGHCEAVLHMILPEQIVIAASKSQSKSLMSYTYIDASILLVDLVGFTALCTPPNYSDSKWMTGDAGNKVSLGIGLFHDIVSIVEELAEKHDVIFVRVTGATLVLASGLPHPAPNRVVSLAHLAHDLLGYVKQLVARRCDKVANGDALGPDMGLGLRMGLSVGRVSSGLVGFHKFNFSVWGFAVDMARGLESIAEKNSLQCDEASRALLAQTGEFNFPSTRPILIRGNSPSASYEVQRTFSRSFVNMSPPSELRFWKEYEAESEQIVIQMIREAEESALHQFVSALQAQSRLQLAGKQGIQMETRQRQLTDIMAEIAQRVENHPDEVETESLANVAADLRSYMEAEIAALRNQHDVEMNNLNTELQIGAREFLEMLADQWPQLMMGSKLSGTLVVPQASKLQKVDTFGSADAYAVCYWNGEKVGQTEVVKDDLNPKWHECSFEVDFFTQATNTLSIELYDYNKGDIRTHAMLGTVTLSGRGVEFLPATQSKRQLEPHPSPSYSDEFVGGMVHFFFRAHHDSEIEEQIRQIWSQVDADGNGTLDRDELYAVLTGMGRENIDMEAAMAEMDEDNSGEVDFDEFRKWYFLQDTATRGMMHMSQNISTAERIFEQVDIDGSGDVSFEEFSSWWSSRAQAGKGEVDDEVLQHSKELFEKYDVDRSGELDKDEFAQMLQGLAYEEWCEASSGGRLYYFNIKTKETRWTLPELGDELLDKFVDRQATLEVSGSKAARRLTQLYEAEVSKRRLGLSDDPTVHRRVQTLLNSKRAVVQQFVDVSTLLFDAIAAKIDRYVKALEKDTVEHAGWLLKARTVPTGGTASVVWKKRWVELRCGPSKGRLLMYRQKPGKREMHSLNLAGVSVQHLAAQSDNDNSAKVPQIASDQPAHDFNSTPAPAHVFTLLSLEPFFDMSRGQTFYQQDSYSFAASNIAELQTWIAKLRLPVTETASLPILDPLRNQKLSNPSPALWPASWQ